MASVVSFQPSVNAPFQFTATLDGSAYAVVVTWSLFGKRWYINIYALDGTRIITTAMIGSPAGYDLNLIGGVFSTSTLVFRQPANQFEIGP